MRLARVANGNFGDTKIITDGVSELLHGNMLESLSIGSSQLVLIHLLMKLIPCDGQKLRWYIGEQKIYVLFSYYSVIPSLKIRLDISV
jgi:hypothetical protein